MDGIPVNVAVTDNATGGAGAIVGGEMAMSKLTWDTPGPFRMDDGHEHGPGIRVPVSTVCVALTTDGS